MEVGGTDTSNHSNQASLYVVSSSTSPSLSSSGTVSGTLTLYRYGVKIVIFNDGRDFRSFRWSCDTRLTLVKVWQQ